MREIDIEAKKEENLQKIEELKSLVWSGFLLAFIVGLAVNQATEIIGYYKGTITVDDIIPTIIITIILCIICLAAYMYSFFRNAISLFENIEKGQREK